VLQDPLQHLEGTVLFSVCWGRCGSAWSEEHCPYDERFPGQWEGMWGPSRLTSATPDIYASWLSILGVKVASEW